MSAGESSQPIGSGPPGSPVSVFQPQNEDPAARRIYKDFTGTTGTPIADGKVGYPTQSKRYARVSLNIKDAAAVVTYRVWERSSYDGGLWKLRGDLGTAGTITADETDPSTLEERFEILGSDRIEVEIVSNGTTTNGFDMWCATNGQVEDG